MHPSMFVKLRDILVERELIRDSRYVTTSKQLAMFLYAMGHGVATSAMCEHFQHSSEPINYYVNCVIKAIALLRFTYIVLPSGTDPVHPHIRHDDQFYPYFKTLREGNCYPFRIQVLIVLACCVVHNFIRREHGEDYYFNLRQMDNIEDDDDPPDDPNLVELTYSMGCIVVQWGDKN
ncbi:hypothetical protein Taro_031365 [Colocasia esculenta]|uniref:DUF8040 domain-containing protein n=1 Tax=Colocasia esculenta TaxID=4460 RepID=A0A843VRR1_COLES|nr:hypothetical protein [Colocasia esculenta]